jgi:hypothetical protein
MDLKFSNAVVTIISALYEGGLDGFVVKDKCRIFTIGHPSKDVVVYCPHLSDRIKEALHKMETANKCNIVIMEEPNFKGYNEEQLKIVLKHITEYFSANLPEASISFQDHSNLVVISLPNTGSSKESDLDLLRAMAFLKQVYSLNLSYVTTKDTSYKIIPEEGSHPVSTESKVVQEHGSGSEVISKDDVLNLHIDLQKINTVEDFLNSL